MYVSVYACMCVYPCSVCGERENFACDFVSVLIPLSYIDPHSADRFACVFFLNTIFVQCVCICVTRCM
jgi:hypothetical protein